MVARPRTSFCHSPTSACLFHYMAQPGLCFTPECQSHTIPLHYVHASCPGACCTPWQNEPLIMMITQFHVARMNIFNGQYLYQQIIQSQQPSFAFSLFVNGGGWALAIDFSCPSLRLLIPNEVHPSHGQNSGAPKHEAALSKGDSVVRTAVV